MSSATLAQMFRPTSIAVIGMSDESAGEASGSLLMRNLLSGAFLGPVLPVHPHAQAVSGLPAFSTIDTLPITPDLAIICSPPDEAARHVTELGKRGTRHVVLMSPEYPRPGTEEAEELRQTLLRAAAPFSVRMLGPNGMGFLSPLSGVNASLAQRDAPSGKVAFVTQSDALFTSVLDWAASKGIGFSHFISLGDRYDIHFGDVLDYLNEDPATRAVLLYLETIKNARRFMSAVRALSRSKPVLVIKAGRSPAGAAAAAAHSGMPSGADDVYDAAFRRAGMLRVPDIDSLFDTAETLAMSRPLKGQRLTILTNGGGPGFLATDMLLEGGGSLAALSNEEESAHSGLASLPPGTARNPLVLPSHADGARYAETAASLLRNVETDALLVMHVPVAGMDSARIADALIPVCRKAGKPVFTNWLGTDDADAARKRFAEAGIPSFFTPDGAVRAFLNLAQYRRNQEMLMEAPASLPEGPRPDAFAARSIVVAALEEKRQVLTTCEAERVLAAYGIPVLETRTAATPEDAAEAAQTIGFPVALKILSPDVYRKSLAGGVALDLNSMDSVLEAALAMEERIRAAQPTARISGFSVQRMSRRVHARELAIETSTDPVFGPVIRFGLGGSLASITPDRQTALPPLNMSLAAELTARTRTHALLRGSRLIPPADMDAVHSTLVRISQLLIDIPEIFEMEIDPLLADQHGVVALDTHVRIAWTTSSGADQLAIRPYPSELEERAHLSDGREVELRPIRPEDEADHWNFLESMTPQDRRFRFFGNVGTLPRTEMIRLTQIDYDREMAFVARGNVPAAHPAQETGSDSASPIWQEGTLGVARAILQPDSSCAEFAVAVRPDCKRLGLGRLLMEKIIRYMKSRGVERITGAALSDNKGMIELARALGFSVSRDFDEGVHLFEISLASPENDAE